MNELPTLAELVPFVERAAVPADAASQLGEALVVSLRMKALGDELVGHFVDRARASGATWEEIGGLLGVSKQAVQKRFRTTALRNRGGLFGTRFSDEAREAVRSALTHAQVLGSSNLETRHLLLGLIDVSKGRASRAIADIGASVEEIRSVALADLASAEGSRTGGHIPFAQESKKALELALREALRLGDRHIGSEHILLGILREQKSPGARILIDRGITRKALEDRIQDKPL